MKTTMTRRTSRPTPKWMNMAKEYVENINDKVEDLNGSLYDAISQVSKEYGVDVVHGLNTGEHKFFAGRRGGISGKVHLMGGRTQREYAARFSGYKGEVRKDKEEDRHDVEDAAGIVEKVLKDTLSSLGIRTDVQVSFKSNTDVFFAINWADDGLDEKLADAIEFLNDQSWKKRSRRAITSYDE